ncbi:MAG: fibronectin type III domain-containing protein [Caldilineaceae bacterium]|nr:fibronectin type III domain-containing protein [Caldilineaceae bacterium]MDE0339077.1 fibronectin type III domain-containing protein [Caldilineaceae bacterium]
MSKSTIVLVLVAAAVLILFGVVRAQGQTYALDTPTLTATEIDGKIVLSWFEVEGATRYDLQVWDCVNKWQRLGEDDWQTTLAAHIDPADGITYLYTMQALNDRGEESDWAAISKSENGAYDFVRETVNPIPSPVFEVVAQADHIQLHFSNVEEAVGYQARVWYPGAGNRWLWLPEENLDLDNRTFSYSDVQPGVDYFFVMRSYSEDKCGFSDWSTYELHTFAGSGTGGITGGGTTDGGTTDGGTGNPSGPGGGEATATATATPNTGGPGPSVPDPGGPGPGTANTATHTPTATATSTGTSTGTPTATATARSVPGSVSLSVASNQNLSATSSQVQISWNHANPSADCYEVAKYYIAIESAGHRRIDTRGDTSGCTNSHSFTGKPGSMHHIRVRGKSGNPAVYGSWSSQLSIRLAAHAGSRPNAPTGVTAANVSNGVQVSWTVDPSKTGNRIDEGDVFEHQIARKTSQAGNWSVIGTAGRSGPYTDRNVSPGGVYFYRVRSRNIHGYSPSGFSGAHTYPPPTATPTPETEPETEPTATATRDPASDECISACTHSVRFAPCSERTQLQIDCQCACGQTDPCANVNCPADPCNDPCNQQQSDCGCTGCGDTCFCGYIHLDGVSTPLHLFLHEMMPYDDVYGVLFGIKWMETQEKNKRVLRTHPYYVLNERHILSEHHAQHAQNEHHDK